MNSALLNLRFFYFILKTHHRPLHHSRWPGGIRDGCDLKKRYVFWKDSFFKLHSFRIRVYENVCPPPPSEKTLRRWSRIIVAIITVSMRNNWLRQSRRGYLLKKSVCTPSLIVATNYSALTQWCNNYSRLSAYHVFSEGGSYDVISPDASR